MMNLKWPIPLALVDWRLPASAAEAVVFCAQHGVNALQVDFGGPGRTPSLDSIGRREALLEASTVHSVTLTALAGNQMNDIGLGLPRDRQDGRALQQLVILMLDTAVQLFIPRVFFPSFHRGAIRDQASLMRLAGLLRWACQEAKDRNLLLANENDLPVSWAKHLVSEVNADNFRLIFDSCNPIKVGHSSMQLLEELHGLFCSHVHIKDGLNGSNAPIALGAGEGSVAAVLTTLTQANWVESYALENDYRQEGSVALTRDLVWLQKFFTNHYRRVA